MTILVPLGGFGPFLSPGGGTVILCGARSDFWESGGTFPGGIVLGSDRTLCAEALPAISISARTKMQRSFFIFFPPLENESTAGIEPPAPVAQESPHVRVHLLSAAGAGSCKNKVQV